MTPQQITDLLTRLRAKEPKPEAGKFHRNYVYSQIDHAEVIEALKAAMQLEYEHGKLVAEMKAQLKETHY